jgi:hypothetical protein
LKNNPKSRANEVETAIGAQLKYAPHRRGGEKYKVIIFLTIYFGMHINISFYKLVI